MKILGISAFYHDSAAALVIDGEVVAAAQEERFTRIKHDPSFPHHAVRYCLDHYGLTLASVDAVVFYDKPLLKFERLLETYYRFAPKGLRSFMVSMPVWMKEKLFFKDMIRKDLKKVDAGGAKVKLLFSEHHISHAASAYYVSPFDKAAVMTIDGVGEWATGSIGLAEGNTIRILEEQHFPHSVGLLYSAFTYFLGFKVNSGEYKLMGLAPYGNPDAVRVKEYEETIRRALVDIKEDGSVLLDQAYFNYATGLTMVQEGKWEQLFGMKRRLPEHPLLQEHCDLALAIQRVTEDIVIRMARHARKLTGADALCLAGGVALNCVANGKLLQEKIFDHIFIQPAAGDAGGALGAALAAHYMYYGKERKSDSVRADRMQGSYLGPEFSDLEIERILRKYNAPYQKLETSELCSAVAGLLAEGKVIGWFQGRMEFGPRALGNRSIIGDPRNPEMQKKLNLKIKYRESFRPFAPSVLEEESPRYFDLDATSPYMLIVADVRREHHAALPENYTALDLREKLYHTRSPWPAITHVDFSARVQTVSKVTNPRYHELIAAFGRLSGTGMIVNTSFNVRGEPIVCTPEDAYRCFRRTEMDYLVLGNYLLDKNGQPEFADKDNWQEEFTLD